MGGTDDPTTGEALLNLLMIGSVGVIIPAAVVLPLVGLGIWLTHLRRRRREGHSA
ncbi:hypothetical protein ACIBAH_15685 [Streptomyces sp. NPDC051445]|uniref:hypothetical protein n=1 Tax=unclassified Streptomyces TaxID=2593676 RepID=UPI003789168D